jgi:type II secretory pathway component GspD/PulD (secretin)
MRHCRFATLLLAVAVVAVWPAGQAGGQDESRRRRSNRTTPAGENQPNIPARGGSSQSAPVKPADTQSARQVHVEILFVEITRAEASKAKTPELAGKTADVEKTLAELKLHGQLKSLQRIKLSVLDGRKATTQLGETAPYVSGTSVRRGGFGGGAAPIARYQMRSFGTLVALTPTVEPAGGIVLDVQFEHSGPQGDDDSPKEPGETTSPSGSRTLTFRNTLRVAAGEFATVASSTFQSKKGTTQVLALATARADAKTAKTTAVPAPEMVVVQLRHAAAGTAGETLRTLFMNRKSPSMLTIADDERTNALIVRGDRASLLEIKALLIRLDEPVKAKP